MTHPNTSKRTETASQVKNFVRPNSALNGKTPAQKTNIETDEAKWMSLIKEAS
jgi:hypothetical protein